MILRLLKKEQRDNEREEKRKKNTVNSANVWKKDARVKNRYLI